MPHSMSNSLMPNNTVLGYVAGQQSKQRTIRCITGYGSSTIDITTGAFCPITAFRKDFDDTYITALDFATVDTNLITLTKPGYYLITYHASLSIPLVIATDVTPSVTKAMTKLRVGGTDLVGTEGYVTMVEIPNLNGLLTVGPGGTLEQNVSGLVVETPVLTTESFMVCDTASGTVDNEYGHVSVTSLCANALTDTELVGGKLQSTPASGTSDVTTNANVIDTSDPSGSVDGTTSATAMIMAKFNSSNVLKIFIGGTEYNPTIGIYGSRAEGTAGCFALNSTISLTKLF